MIYVAKEKLKQETKTRLSKSIMCKRYAAFAMQIVQIVQCKTTASVSEVIIMFKDN